MLWAMWHAKVTTSETGMPDCKVLQAQPIHGTASAPHLLSLNDFQRKHTLYTSENMILFF